MVLVSATGRLRGFNGYHGVQGGSEFTCFWARKNARIQKQEAGALNQVDQGPADDAIYGMGYLEETPCACVLYFGLQTQRSPGRS